MDLRDMLTSFLIVLLAGLFSKFITKKFLKYLWTQ